jgi:hypothetical protein
VIGATYGGNFVFGSRKPGRDSAAAQPRSRRSPTKPAKERERYARA